MAKIRKLDNDSVRFRAASKLEREIAQLTVYNDFLKQILEKHHTDD